MSLHVSFVAVKHMLEGGEKYSLDFHGEDKRQVGSVSSFIETHSSC